MLEKARKASMEDRTSKRLKGCLGNSTFRPTSFIRILLPVFLLPRRTRGLPHHWTPHFPTDLSLSPPATPYQEAASACSHATSLPRHQGPSHTFDDSFVPTFLSLLVTLLSHTPLSFPMTHSLLRLYSHTTSHSLLIFLTMRHIGPIPLSIVWLLFFDKHGLCARPLRYLSLERLSHSFLSLNLSGSPATHCFADCEYRQDL